jgi:uncharacterized protein (DUF1778 family)
MSDTATVSLRLPTELIQHIDDSAAQAGQNRTNYILSWLPEAYEPAHSTTDQRSNEAAKQRR